MSRRHHIALAGLFALTTIGVTAAQRPASVSEPAVGDLLRRTDASVAVFRASFDREVDRSRINADRTEIKESVNDLQLATGRVRDRARNRRGGATGDVEDVLRRASTIESFMNSNTLDAAVERDWLDVRRNLDELARAYSVSTDWSNPRSTGGDQRTARRQPLTGTYRLDTSRGGDSAKAVQQATQGLPAKKRQAASLRLTNRLNSPETIVIDRNRNSVTMASSRGRPVTFEADGQVRQEQGPAGRTINTRATLTGDQLLVTTTGNKGNDFTVTLEPIDNGSNLRVTRRLQDDGLRQPVTVVSFYRRTSEEAQWETGAVNQRAPSRTDSSRNDLGVPDGTRLIGRLDSALNTRTTNAEDRFTITTLSPSQYEGAVIEGTISSVDASGRVSGRAEMAFNLERIRLRNGRTFQFDGVIESVRTADGETIHVSKEGAVGDGSQTEKTVERGAIGAALGAIIGAIGGGGQGAAIGAAIGAGGGAGTVIAQGRGQLELGRGTELTITSGNAENQPSATSGQR
jgi:hypothetical protein